MLTVELITFGISVGPGNMVHERATFRACGNVSEVGKTQKLAEGG